jgi:hypothetical protein
MSAQFLGRFLVELLKDDQAGLWRHHEPFGFRSSVAGIDIWAPAGHTTDFCSVPRVPLAYELLGNRARMAGSIHDWLYTSKILSREMADRVLREMLVLDGVSEFEAEEFYLAVRAFGGSHWEPEQSAGDQATAAALASPQAA